MQFLLRSARVLSLVFFSVLGTSVLMYAAPGYFTDAGELDAAHASVTRTELHRLAGEQASLGTLLQSELRSWSHGDLGRSRQFGTPVGALVKERAWRSVRLLTSGVLAGWCLALSLALPFSLCRRKSLNVALAGITALLLALPVGVLATLCLVGNMGGPVLVLATVIAARDLKLLHRILGTAWRAPYVLHAHTSGLSFARIFRIHVLPNISGELLAVTVMSFTLALSALVPVEVIFDISGLGQLAWSAAMNRDLPVLIAVTALMSTCVGIAGWFAERSNLENVPCA